MKLGLHQGLLDEAARCSLKQIRLDQREVNPKIRKLLVHLEEQLFDPSLNVTQLRLSCGIRDPSVTTEFRRALGASLKVYLEVRRMETAANLLRHTELRVAEIGDLVGYSAPTTFRQAFGRCLGVAPQKFRRRLHEESALSDQPDDEYLTFRFWRQALIGEGDPKQVERLLRHLQQLYPDVFPADKETPNNAGQLRLEIDGRDYEQTLAEKVWQRLTELTPARQRYWLRHEVAFRSTALYQLLLRKSREEGRKDRQRGVEVAMLALDTVDGSAALLRDDPVDLRARAWAWIGNARRLALDFPGAERAFDRAAAEWRLPRRASDPVAKAEINLCLAGLRLDQRKFQEALGLVNLALPVFRESSHQQQLIEAIILRASVLCYMGDASGVKELERLLREPVVEIGDHLALSATSLAAAAHALACQPIEARHAVDKARQLAVRLSNWEAQHQLDWIEGLLCTALGDTATAESFLISARIGLEEVGAPFHAAALALDLAILYDTQGRNPEVLALISDCLPVLVSLGVDRESALALELLEKAAITGQSLATCILQVRAAIQTVLRLPPLQVAST